MTMVKILFLFISAETGIIAALLWRIVLV